MHRPADSVVQAGAPERVLDPRINQFPVNWAIYLGSAIYARDYSPDKAARRACGEAVVQEYQQVLQSFPASSAERVYLTRILNIAVDLAIGIRTKKEIRASRLEDATKNRDLHYQRMVKAERWQGVLRLAAKLMLLSGFGYAIARAVLNADGGDAQGTLNDNWASAAFGMGFALVATYVRSWVIDRRIGTLFRTHDDECRIAHTDYQRSVTREYRWAADEAIDAWERMTGRRPEMNTAAMLALLCPQVDHELDPEEA